MQTRNRVVTTLGRKFIIKELSASILKCSCSGKSAPLPWEKSTGMSRRAWNVVWFSESLCWEQKVMRRALSRGNEWLSYGKDMRSFLALRQWAEGGLYSAGKAEEAEGFLWGHIWEKTEKQRIHSTGAQLSLELEKQWEVSRHLPEDKGDRWNRGRQQRVLPYCISNQSLPEGILGQESRKQTGGPRSVG